MKICIDAREFVKDRKTGIARYIENLLTPTLTEPDLKIVLFVSEPEFIPEQLRSAVKCIKLPAVLSIVIDQVILPGLIKEENADVFFSPYYKTTLTGNFKRIITVHDIMFIRSQESGVSRLRQGYGGRAAVVIRIQYPKSP